MGWYSTYGTGATLHGIRQSESEPGRVEFTSWISVFWIPLIPLRSWSAVYAGEALSDLLPGDGHAFADLKRIPHEPALLLQTFARGIVTLAIAILPAAYMIYRTQGRAANKVEVAFALASAFWPVAVIIYLEHRQKTVLQGSQQVRKSEP